MDPRRRKLGAPPHLDSNFFQWHFSAEIWLNNRLLPSSLSGLLPRLENPGSATVNLNDTLTEKLNTEFKSTSTFYIITIFHILGSRKGRYDFFRKHEYVMRNRELGKKTKDGAKQTKENRSQTPEENAGVTRLTLDVSNTDTRMLDSVDCSRPSTELQTKSIISTTPHITTITTNSKSDGSTRSTSDDPCSSPLELDGSTDLQNFIASPKPTGSPSPISILSDLLPRIPDGIEPPTEDPSDIPPSVSTNSSMLSNIPNSFKCTGPSNKEESDEVRGKCFYSLMEEKASKRSFKKLVSIKSHFYRARKMTQ